MTEKKCNGNCCDSFFENYDDIEDDYDIERLEDIIEICQFLIKTKKHRIQKRETMKKLFEESEEEKDNNSYTHTITNQKVHPYYIYRYKYPPYIGDMYPWTTWF